MNVKPFNKRLFRFLESSPTSFHAIENIANILEKSGFLQLSEEHKWNLRPGQPYFVVRENGALAAFCRNEHEEGFRILGAHADSPALQLKPNPDIFENSYHQWGVEVYGGALLGPWFDRELGLAGRLVCRGEENRLAVHLVNFDRPCAVIPSTAIHLDRDANKERSINAQTDIVPLAGLAKSRNKTIADLLAAELQKDEIELSAADILGFDLFLYDYHTPTYIGVQQEFILASRLDNLLSSFIATIALTTAPTDKNFLFICNNHEEIGSTTASGAQGNMLLSLLTRLYPDPDARYRMLARSFCLSLDNAHAVHPNNGDKHDPNHRIYLNGGPVLKLNAGHRYASTALSSSLFKCLCSEAKVDMQEFVMRSDLPCGSTIGPLTAAKLGLKTVDVGAATLAMHSPRELTGTRDPLSLFTVVNHFLQRHELPEIH